MLRRLLNDYFSHGYLDIYKSQWLFGCLLITWTTYPESGWRPREIEFAWRPIWKE